MKAFVIGLDGATFDILEPLMQAGYMPHLRQALEQGATARLLSTIPPVTALAWPTFMTGKNPGKHGLLGWQEPLNARFQRPWISGNQIVGDKLWHIAGRAGLRVCIVNVPVTYPPEAVHGVLVTGMLTPGLHTRFTYPEALKADLLAAVPDYQLDLDVQRARYATDSRQALNRLLDGAVSITRRRGQAMRWLLHREQPDLAMIVFEMPDRLQHILWRYIEPLPAIWTGGGPWAATVQRKLLTCYRTLDQEIGSLLDGLPSDAYLVFLSDHGFGPFRTHVYLNDWLAQHGWLHYSTRRARTWDMLRAMGRQVKRWLPAPLLWRAKQRAPLLTTFDWARTWAYAGLPTEDGIFLNVQGREPAGIVTGADYESLRSEIMAALREWQDPDTGRLVFKRVYRREEVYTGPFTARAPDILFEMEEGYRISEWKARNSTLEPVSQPWGIHKRDGILGFSGPGIPPRLSPAPAFIQDIAPTLLHVLGLPIPDDLDGQVLETIFTSAWWSAHPVHYRPATERSRGSSPATPYSVEEEDAISARLRGLGYLDE